MIVVLTGGKSSEREVSLATANNVSTSLDKLSKEYKAIDIAQSGWLDKLVRLNPSTVFIALHGTFAEDGELQKILESIHIKFTGSSSAVSKLCFDKKLTKEKVKNIGIVVPQDLNFSQLESNEFIPVVIKPNKEGSSIGVSIVKTKEKLKSAIQDVRLLTDDILIEEYIKGRELSCGVIDTFGQIQALPIIEIKPKSEFFDYKAKYTPGGSEEICPADLDNEFARKIQDQSISIFKKLKIRQYARVDWILKNNTPYFLEINTLPGMTNTSLINQELEVAGITLEQFISSLIETA